jgi:hypothetical protein
MKLHWHQWFGGWGLCGSLILVGLAQSTQIPMAQAPVAAAASPPSLEILSFKIVSYYNPLLERSPALDADSREVPRTPAEQVSRAQRTTAPSHQERANEIGIAPGAAPNLKVISSAEWVYFTVKNTAPQPIKSLLWEYTYLRVEQGHLAIRATVSSPVEIKPGAKKTLRQQLPPGATRCQVINAREAGGTAGPHGPYEYVCGRGFTDPTLLNERLEPVVVKRIEYADGMVWPRL